MPITIKTLTQLLTSLFYLTSPTAFQTEELPPRAGEQIVFTSEAKLIVKDYQLLPCPVKLENYINIFDEVEERCVYIAPEDLIKLSNSLNSQD
jgi:hypothetical protein